MPEHTIQNSEPPSALLNKYWFAFVILLVLAGFCLTRIYSYLLFHSLTEIFAVVIGVGIHTVAWNARRYMNNSYFLFIGIAFLFISVLGTLHTLAYKGMGVFLWSDTSDLATQLWIAARYLTCLSFLFAPAFIGRKPRLGPLFGVYSVIVILLLLSILYWRIFPQCYIEGQGLTPFKVISEYIIIAVFLASAVLVYLHRYEFDKVIYRMLLVALLFMIASELAFTLYKDVYDISNTVGHIFLAIAFFHIYKAVIATGLSRPFDLLFRDLKASEERLQYRAGELSHLNAQLHKEVAERVRAEKELDEHRQYLEKLVNERTAQLRDSNKRLENEITERKRAEDELRALYSSILQRLDEERRNIARELHDQTGQSLTVLNLLLAKIKRSLDEKAVHTISDVDESQTVVKELMQQVRALSTTLHPSMLDNIGLVSTLEWYTREFTNRTGITIKLASGGQEGDLPSRLRISVYRIIQEALTNIARYAETKEAFIRVEFTDNTLKLHIEDRGKGFDPSTISLTSSGIRSMRERVYSLKGNIEVFSSAGAGTRIEVDLPLKQP
jgi:signal transduction histidine kinase